MANEYRNETLTQDGRRFDKRPLCFESSCQLKYKALKLRKRKERDTVATRPLSFSNCIFINTTRPSALLHRRPKIFLSCMMASLLWNLIISVNAFHPFYTHNYVWLHRVRDQSWSLQAKITSSSAKQTIEQVQPLTSSTKQRRVTVEKAWEKAQSLAINESKEDESLSSTPYLDLFTKATNGENLSNKFSTRQTVHARPRGRPESVPGAMSRTTVLTLNTAQSNIKVKEDQYSKVSDMEDLELTDNMSSVQKRGRGRPRKNSQTHMTVEEITSVAASSTSNINNSGSDELGSVDKNNLVEGEENGLNKSRKSRVKVLPKSRKMKESDMEEETTGMMPSGKSRQNGDIDTPNLQLQRYYRTPLLTQEDEYSLGMKIQFLMKCEQVHEGLYQLLGRVPSIMEWANACGFTEDDPIRSRPDYEETELETQLRPVKSEAWDEEHDPNMFIGNGLAYDSGPGRGRGRAKKTPPTSLKDYYDDSDYKFCQDQKKPSKKLPINRGTPQDFVDLMLIGKEAKQKMVQSNMRLVVSISKRYKHVGVNVADLVQEGSIGLTRAAEKFDPKKGFKFSTYASW
jgi:DNA-directed RNA polymerase, sigma subunit (sigma70/sigma32)